MGLRWSVLLTAADPTLSEQLQLFPQNANATAPGQAGRDVPPQSGVIERGQLPTSPAMQATGECQIQPSKQSPSERVIALARQNARGVVLSGKNDPFTQLLEQLRFLEPGRVDSWKTWSDAGSPTVGGRSV